MVYALSHTPSHTSVPAFVMMLFVYNSTSSFSCHSLILTCASVCPFIWWQKHLTKHSGWKMKHLQELRKVQFLWFKALRMTVTWMTDLHQRIWWYLSPNVYIFSSTSAFPLHLHIEWMNVFNLSKDFKSYWLFNRGNRENGIHLRHVNLWFWNYYVNHHSLRRSQFSTRVREKQRRISTSWTSHEIPGYVPINLTRKRSTLTDYERSGDPAYFAWNNCKKSWQ